MAVKVSGEYLGALRTKSIHGPSNSILETDAPTDNNGKGEKFSPTDLVGTALAACMLTIMSMLAERSGIEMKGVTYSVEKHMSEDMPRRIVKLIIEFNMPKDLSDEQKKKLEKAAHTCPVHYSLNPEIDKQVSFNY